MVPSTLYSLSFLIGLSIAAPAADYGYSSSKKCTTTTPPPTSTCTGGAKNTHGAAHSSKGGYHSAEPYYPAKPPKGHATYPTTKEYYPSKGHATYPTTKEYYPTKAHPTKAGHPTHDGYPYETSTSKYKPHTTTYHSGHSGHNNGTYSVTLAPETTEYPSMDPFPDSTTTSDDFTITDDFSSTTTDMPTTTTDIDEPTTTTDIDEPTTTTDIDEPTPTDDPLPGGEILIAPGPLGDDVTFSVDRDVSIGGSIFDQSEVPQQVIDDDITLDFCAGACAISSYVCEAFELFTNEFDVLVCALKFELGEPVAAPGSISGLIIDNEFDV